MRIFLVVLVLAFLSAQVFAQESTYPLLKQKLEEVTGKNAIDCGRLPSVATINTIITKLSCSFRANLLGKPFRLVKLSRSMIDSNTAYGLVGKGDGVVWFFYYDSSPAGIGSEPRFELFKCDALTLIIKTGYNGFTCEKKSSF